MCVLCSTFRTGHPPVAAIQAYEAPKGMRIGTIATRDIKAEEVYLAVPLPLIMDNKSAFKYAVAVEYRSTEGAGGACCACL